MYKYIYIYSSYVLLVYDENVARHFWKIFIVTGVLPSQFRIQTFFGHTVLLKLRIG